MIKYSYLSLFYRLLLFNLALILGNRPDWSKMHVTNNEPEYVTLFNYRSDNPSKAEIINSNGSIAGAKNIAHRKRTIFLLHGWANRHKKGYWTESLKDRLLEKYPDDNIIVIDWREFAKYEYPLSKKTYLSQAALIISRILQEMVEIFTISPMQMIFVGNSMGAHLAGLVAIDPAGVMFDDDSNLNRLERGDAVYVESMSTDAGSVFIGHCGSYRNVGDRNVIVNGGRTQPGCAINKRIKFLSMLKGTCTCDHSRAYELYPDFFNLHSECKPIAFKCNSYENFIKGQCFDCTQGNCMDLTSSMDHRLPQVTTPDALYYLETGEKSPYCGKHSNEIN